MGLVNKVKAKANKIQGEVDEKRGHKHDDDFLIAEGRVLQENANERLKNEDQGAAGDSEDT
ncbi:hypothetical protein GCM10009847_05110 [Leucobacter tardus]|uniref:CsbD family protein n=1 Tax=Leucobacter tardus TaxID=501483 RepID=A0A939QAL8_9MICO|nr:hypothetical protein [Leucobacter tardus]MBO2988715.1 hypothetical protein [Leucobacter tardus]